MHADRVLFVELFYAMIDGVELERAESITVPLQEIYPGDAPGTYRIPISGANWSVRVFWMCSGGR